MKQVSHKIEQRPHDIAERLRQIAADVEASVAPAADWVEATDNDVRSTDEIAGVCACSPDTIRRRAESSAAEGYPLGIQHCGVWLLSLRRVLTWVERHQGRHARLQCESRAKKIDEMRPSPQLSRLDSAGAAR